MAIQPYWSLLDPANLCLFMVQVEVNRVVIEQPTTISLCFPVFEEHFIQWSENGLKLIVLL